MRYAKFLAVAGFVALLGWGIFFIARSVSRSADRKEAIQLANQKKFADAIPKLKEVLDRNPDDVEAIEKLVACLIASGALRTDVLPLLNRWCKLKASEPLPFLMRMDTLFVMGRGEEALADAQHVLELQPDTPAARWVAGQVLRDAGRHQESVKECRELLKAEGGPPRHEVLMLLVQNLLARGELQEAATLIDTVLRERPDYEPGLLYRGMVQFKQEKYDSAITALTRAARSMNTRIRQPALYHLGMSLNKAGRAQEAQTAFDRLAADQRAIRYRADADQIPGDWDLQMRAARALVEADRLNEAAQFLEKALARLGDSPAALTLLADCLDKLGNKRLAAEIRRKLAAGRN